MLQLFLGVAALAALYYYFCIKPMNHWKKRGIPQTNPRWLFGDDWSSFTRQESGADMLMRCYNQFPNHRYFGWYQFSTPTLMIKDPELIKQITVKKFDHFMDHKSMFPEGLEPLWSKNLFALTGKKWRDMRPILTPAFTSSKMREMIVRISECSEKFIKHHLEEDKDLIEVEMKDLLSRFTNDVIATTAFGVEVDSLKHPKNEFYSVGRETFGVAGLLSVWKMFGYLMIPEVYHFFKVSVSPFPKRIGAFFSKLIEDTITLREERNIVRLDMIHLLMKAKKYIGNKKESVAVESGSATMEEADIAEEAVNRNITNTDITAHALIFFFAGFESISSLMCFMSYELAVNNDIQTRLRAEIEETLHDCEGKLTYGALMEMKYMDMVVSETMRKWPTTVLTDRVCTKPFTIEPVTPEEKPLHLEKNAVLTISMYALHRDPRYHPEPDRFNPERFNDDNKGKINPYTYAPFGFGPRTCIGSRFALLETKVIFFHLLTHFELVPVQKTHIPMKLSKQSFNLLSEGGFWLGMKKLKK